MIYTHGGNSQIYGEGLIDFSANISPLGMPKDIKKAAEKAVSESIEYPDFACEKLKYEISKREGVEFNHIACGNGAAELIYSLMYSLHPEKSLIHSPSFSEYSEAAVAAGSTIVYEGDADIEFICNPNNPTGVLTSREIIEEKLNENRIIFVDECFNDFLEEPQKYSCVDMIKEHKNLVILKSFTKMYAIPGLRLGYLLCSDDEIIENLYKKRQPWSVSNIAQAAGIAACKDIETPKKVREYVAKEREYIVGEFKRLNIDYIDPSANFIFFRENKDLREMMLQKNILIRKCDNGFRVAIKKHKENIMLIRALEEVLWQNQ